MTKRALIIGITGQDGSLLAANLLERGWEVHGLYRHSSINNLTRVTHLLPRLTLHRGDVTDYASVTDALRRSCPDVVFHEADQDNVAWSRDVPRYAADVTFGGTLNVLEAVREFCPDATRVFVPCSATVFGEPAASPQNEDTPFDPRSPYAVAKAGCYHLARMYRRERGMHVSTAILYNHDSHLRTEQYLLHKIARGAVRIARGGQKTLSLGNLDQVVDIGWAPEFVDGIVRLMELDTPEDVVLGTGVGYTIGRLVTYALGLAGAADRDGRVDLGRLATDPEHHRPLAPSPLVADVGKARRLLGWDAPDDASDVVARLVKCAAAGDML